MTEMLTRKEHLADLRTAVYRFFGANGELLYLGITHDLQERWGTHERIQPWWLDVSRREFTWYDTRAEAEEIEATATAVQKPRYDRSGQRTTGGEVDQRLAAEKERAMDAISADIDNGTYPLWRLLPSYGSLSAKYGIPLIGITRALTKLAHDEQTLVYHQDQFAVSLPGIQPSRDAQRIGLSYFLASNAFGGSTFTRADLVETTGVSEGTAHQHLKRWQETDRVERLEKVSGSRALIYRIVRHPEPDPPKVLLFWGKDDVLAMAQWLNDQLDTDPATDDRDREIIKACLPDEYGVSNAGVRVLKVMARRYRERSGCLPEWGIGREES
ncbi:hypothetical protein [Streptomyces sp. NBC_01483]|uniref:hypothetical protein n=1 Tax=Streptomyces sp. NBC_01483 TaxID=2903883 RepID=UPI002E331F4C|nr:hypothetical protein [Streptomyces sp. NBC_01483]